MQNYKTGDIVFVKNYTYKNGSTGNNHLFIIISDTKAITIDYYGFLLTSNKKKKKYPYNLPIPKDNTNHLNKDSIAKCDDLITLNRSEISYSIGCINEEQIKLLLKLFNEYLNNK